MSKKNYILGGIILLVVVVGIFAMNNKAQVANPASVHCTEELGGTLEIVNTEEGQLGACHLPNGDVCEEWALYRTGECVPINRAE